MAANQLALTFGLAAFPFYWGITSASATFIGSNIKNTNNDQIKKIIKSSYLLSFITSLLIGLVIFLFAINLATFVKLSAETIHLAYVLILLVAAYQLADCFQSVCAGILRGFAVIYPVLFSNIISYYIIGLATFIFLYYVMDLGYTSIWWAFFVGVNASAIINVKVVAIYLKKRVVATREREKLVNISIQ